MSARNVRSDTARDIKKIPTLSFAPDLTNTTMLVVKPNNIIAGQHGVNTFIVAKYCASYNTTNADLFCGESVYVKFSDPFKPGTSIVLGKRGKPPLIHWYFLSTLS